MGISLSYSEKCSGKCSSVCHMDIVGHKIERLTSNEVDAGNDRTKCIVMHALAKVYSYDQNVATAKSRERSSVCSQ